MFIPAHEFVQKAKSGICEISLEDAEKIVVSKASLVLDVREPGEFQEGHLLGAVNIPRGMLEFVLSAQPELQDTSKEVLVYCKTGGRAALAAVSMQAMGFENVKSIAGGYDGWHASGRMVALPNISFD